MSPLISFILLCYAALSEQPEPRTVIRAEMVLLFQNPDGGWPKNVGWNSFETLSDAKEGFKKFPMGNFLNPSFASLRVSNEFHPTFLGQPPSGFWNRSTISARMTVRGSGCSDKAA